MLSRAAVGSRIVGRPYALPYARFVPKMVNHIAFGLVVEDVAHSAGESRFHALGTTAAGRGLHVTFTLRAEGTKIRVISARDMNRKERLLYERTTEEGPKVPH